MDLNFTTPTFSTILYVINTTNITSTNSLIATSNEEVTKIIGCFCFVLILIIGTTGNGLIIYYFGYKRHARRSIPEMLFHYLAVVDCVASIFNPMLYIYWILTNYQWHFGYWACKIVVPIGTIATTTSGGIFLIIAIDRQRTIVHPFKSHYKRTYIKLSVLGAILYAFLTNLHYSLNVEIFRGNQCLVPRATKLSYSIPTLICFVLQDLVLVIIFAFTNYRIFSQLQQKDTSLIVGKLSAQRKRDATRIIRLLVVLVTVFFILTLPRDLYQVVFLLSWLDGNGIQLTGTILHINSFLKILHTANSCVNVFIYFRMHRGFRNSLYQLLPCIEKSDFSASVSFKSFRESSQRKTKIEETVTDELLSHEMSEYVVSENGETKTLRQPQNHFMKKEKKFGDHLDVTSSIKM